MKKLVLLLTLILMLALIVLVGNWNKYVSEKPISPTPTQAVEDKKDTIRTSFPNELNIALGDRLYRVAFEKVERTNSLILIPNFWERRKAYDVVKNYHCLRAINAGFYTTSYLPLGLFSIKGEVLGKTSESTLTNGFFWIDEAGVAHIDSKSPADTSLLTFIFQSGPLIKSDGISHQLTINNDESARRMFLAVDKNKEVVFLTVFDNDSPLAGPYLSSLPEILTLIEEKIGLTFTDVLNLDGGTASTFISGESSLEELVLVGSFLCERE